MVAGRLKWTDEAKPIPKRGGLAPFDFSTGSLLLTEAGTRRTTHQRHRGAFADEILHAAKLSPTPINTNLSDAAISRLYEATRAVLSHWTRIRIEETGVGFPTKVTAFHPDMAVRGKFGEPCPDPAHRHGPPRNELLPDVPHRRKDPERQGTFTTPERRLAKYGGRAVEELTVLSSQSEGGREL